MTQDPIPVPDYQQLIEAVAAEITQGVARLRQSYTAELVRTSWNIGRVITEISGPDDGRSPRNAAIVARLAANFKRPEAFFYNVIKFYRLYPTLPRTNLTWSHYVLLMSIADPRARRQLEQKASRENIGAKDLRAYITVKKDSIPLITSTKSDQLKYTRGELYHYRTMQAPTQFEAGRILLDVGFHIEHDVVASDSQSQRSGYIARAVKEGEDYGVRLVLPKPELLYTYQAFVNRVVDGDTLLLRVDLGFRTHVTEKVRLRGIDCPEISTALGRKARIFVQELIDQNPWIVIKTYKDDKYGRYLVDVFTGPKDQDAQTIARQGQYLNQTLLDKGLAVLMF